MRVLVSVLVVLILLSGPGLAQKLKKIRYADTRGRIEFTITEVPGKATWTVQGRILEERDGYGESWAEFTGGYGTTTGVLRGETEGEAAVNGQFDFKAATFTVTFRTLAGTYEAICYRNGKKPEPAASASPTPKPGQDPIVGTWRWFQGGDVEMTAAGAVMHQGAQAGTWKLDEQGPPRKYIVVWNSVNGKSYTDTLFLTGSSLEGTNNENRGVSAQKL